MVKILPREKGDLYVCEDCGFKYLSKETAEKCEAWCHEHRSCNLEITKLAVQEENDN